PALPFERLQADEQEVPGEARVGAVGRVAVADRPDGEHLPQRLLGAREPIEEGESRRTDGAAAVRPRQRGGVEEDAGGPLLLRPGRFSLHTRRRYVHMLRQNLHVALLPAYAEKIGPAAVAALRFRLSGSGRRGASPGSGSPRALW